MSDGEHYVDADNQAGEEPNVHGGSQGAPERASRKRRKPEQTTLSQVTLRKPQWTYFHLVLQSSPPTSLPVDAPSARLYLTSALRQFLGLTGEAIPIDILKIQDQAVWIRVPHDDALAITSSLPGWVGGKDGASVGWMIKGRDDWLARLSGGNGMDLFGGRPG